MAQRNHLRVARMRLGMAPRDGVNAKAKASLGNLSKRFTSIRKSTCAIAKHPKILNARTLIDSDNTGWFLRRFLRSAQFFRRTTMTAISRPRQQNIIAATTIDDIRPLKADSEFVLEIF